MSKLIKNFKKKQKSHIILIGRVEHLTTRSTAPLLFYRGRYAVPEYEQSAEQKRVRLTLDT